MTKTFSAMPSLGIDAPDFLLPDVVSGLHVGLTETKQTVVATVVAFICNHCPYVKHINGQLVEVAHEYGARNVRFIAINSNDAESYPDDAPAQMKAVALALNYPFPYLYDETQEVAKAYQAQCTPDFFVFDARLKLAYRGQMDDARPGNQALNDGHSLREALDHLLANQPVSSVQKPSMGCNIKWKRGAS